MAHACGWLLVFSLCTAGCAPIALFGGGGGGGDDDREEEDSGGGFVGSGGSSGVTRSSIELEGCSEVAKHGFDEPLSDIVVENDHAYAFEMDYLDCYGLHVWDVALPATPLEVGATLEGICGETLAVSGGRLYTHNRDAGLLLLSDVSTPSQPRGIASIAVDAGVLAVSASHAYLQGTLGLHVVDVGTPQALSVLPSAAVRGDDIALAGERAYVAGGQQRLQVVSLSNPAAPSPSTSVGTSSLGARLLLAGSLAYVTDSSGLYVFDLSTPVPTQVGVYLSIWQVRDLALAGSRLLVTTADGINLLDVGDPALPTLLASSSTFNLYEHVAAIGGTFYVITSGALGGTLHVLTCQ